MQGEGVEERGNSPWRYPQGQAEKWMDPPLVAEMAAYENLKATERDELVKRHGFQS